MKRLLAVAAMALTIGCADLREYTDAQLIGSRNHYLARRSWKTNGHVLSGRKHAVEFRQGYLDGYLAVAEGRGTCPPVMPPEAFWGACYQDACGQERINDWFAGYNEGVAAGSRDGVGGVSQIPSWCQPEGGCGGPMTGVPPALQPVGPRKPRRGDPPVRATLPPDDDTPKSSTEKAPDRPEPAPLDPIEKEPVNEPTKDPAKDPLGDLMPPNAKSTPKHEVDNDPGALPLNPFAPRTAKKTPPPTGVPANPPILQSEQPLKSSKKIEAETPKPTKTVDEDAGPSVPDFPAPPKAEVKPRGPRPGAILPASAKVRTAPPPSDDDGDWGTPHDGAPRGQIAGRDKDRDFE